MGNTFTSRLYTTENGAIQNVRKDVEAKLGFPVDLGFDNERNQSFFEVEYNGQKQRAYIYLEFQNISKYAKYETSEI